MHKRDLELCSNEYWSVTGSMHSPEKLEDRAGQHQQIDIWRNPALGDMWRMDWKGTREEDQFAGQCSYPGQR